MMTIPDPLQLVCVQAPPGLIRGLEALGQATRNAELEAPLSVGTASNALLLHGVPDTPAFESFLLRFRKAYPRAPALLLSPDPEDQRELVFEHGLDGVAPPEPERLLTRVRDAIAARAPRDMRSQNVLLAVPRDSPLRDLPLQIDRPDLVFVNCDSEDQLLTRLRQDPCRALLVGLGLDAGRHAIRCSHVFEPELPKLHLTDLHHGRAFLERGLVHGRDFCIVPESHCTLVRFLEQSAPPSSPPKLRSLSFWHINGSVQTRQRLRICLLAAGHGDWDLTTAPLNAWPPAMGVDCLLLELGNEPPLLELLRLHSQRPELPVVVLHDQVPRALKQACLAAGASAVLSVKDLDGDVLAGTLLRAIAQLRNERSLKLTQSSAQLAAQLEARSHALQGNAAALNGLAVKLRDHQQRATRENQRLAGKVRELQRLTEAVAAVAQPAGFQDMLQRTAEQARRLVGATGCIVSSLEEGDWQTAHHGLAVAKALQSKALHAALPRDTELEVCRRQGALRLRGAQVASLPPEARPWLWQLDAGGWIGLPLYGEDGSSQALIQVSKGFGTDFDPRDEALLIQFAQIVRPRLTLGRMRNQQRSLRKQLQTAEGQLKKAQEVADNIAHDLRTPVTRVRGLVETSLLDAAPLDPQALACAVAEECDGLLYMIDTMLDISQIDAGTIMRDSAPVDLAEILQTAAELYRPGLDALGIELSLVGAASPRLLVGNRNMLQRAIANLLDNAVKHSPRSSRITLSLRADDKGWFVLSVQDQGSGIAGDELRRVFDRFYRPNAFGAVPGSGLGLSLVRSIVRAHGGEISVRSSLGVGSEFALSFPAEGSARTGPSGQASAAGPEGSDPSLPA